MYAYHAVFSEDRRSLDEERFWFQNSLHSPEPFFPFDCVWYEHALTAPNQANARLFVVPSSLGVENRILNGYVYVSANSVTDEEILARRAELFRRRGGHYYRHWAELYERWVEKVEETTRELEALVVAGVARARGRGRRHRGSRRRLEPPAPRRVRRPARGARPHDPVPLRAEQPGLRRLPRLLRALPARPSRTSRTRRSPGWSRASTSSSCVRTRS